MRKPALILAALLALAGSLSAQSVKLPDVKGDPGTIVIVKAETDCASLRWIVLDPGLTMIPPDLLKDSKTAVVMAGKAGKYRLLAYGALKDMASEPGICTVTIGEPAPPVPPPPPGPGPGPGPTPGPTPSPAPIPDAGFRVLIIYESKDLPRMPAAQWNILFTKGIRDYLNSRCVVGPDGKTKEWRIYDADVDTSGESKLWQEAMKRPRKSVPWIVISNPGLGGYEGPLPANVDEALTLLKKYGGA